MNDGFQKYHPFIGDLHNHCNISYGHGELEDALRNAQLQLDFVSVTGHAGCLIGACSRCLNRLLPTIRRALPNLKLRKTDTIKSF